MKSNPFATRFVKPGQLPWHAGPGAKTVQQLSTRFNEQLKRRGAIVGPHGSGKSTLLEHLVPTLGTVWLRRAAFESHDGTSVDRGEAAGHRPIVWLQLRGRKVSSELVDSTRTYWQRSGSLLVIDGYEQLSVAKRAILVVRTAKAGAGLLVTSHRATALPTLFSTAVDVHLARALLEHLLPDDLPDRRRWLEEPQLAQLLELHHSNLREVFMALYDKIDATKN